MCDTLQSKHNRSLTVAIVMLSRCGSVVDLQKSIGVLETSRRECARSLTDFDEAFDGKLGHVSHIAPSTQQANYVLVSHARVLGDISNIVGCQEVVKAAKIHTPSNQMLPVIDCDSSDSSIDTLEFYEESMEQWDKELEVSLEQDLELKFEEDAHVQLRCAEEIRRQQGQGVDLQSRIGVEQNGAHPQLGLPRFPATHVVASQPQNLKSDPQWVAEYSGDVLRHMLRNEYKGLGQQSNGANEELRALLVDWIVEVHLRLGLETQTLFLAINLIDRYLRKSKVADDQFQLLGITALFVASKFEEVNDSGKDLLSCFVHMCGGNYSMQDMLEMECRLLSALDFDLARPTAIMIAEHLMGAQRLDGMEPVEDEKELACYILELSLLDNGMQQYYSPSCLAMSAMLLASDLLGERAPWPESMDERAGQMTRDRLKGCLEELRTLLKGAPTSPFQAVPRKFMSMQRSGVARLNLV